jgi:hypothetical protein
VGGCSARLSGRKVRRDVYGGVWTVVSAFWSAWHVVCAVLRRVGAEQGRVGQGDAAQWTEVRMWIGDSKAII